MSCEFANILVISGLLCLLILLGNLQLVIILLLIWFLRCNLPCFKHTILFAILFFNRSSLWCF